MLRTLTQQKRLQKPSTLYTVLFQRVACATELVNCYTASSQQRTEKLLLPRRVLLVSLWDLTLRQHPSPVSTTYAP